MEVSKRNTWELVPLLKGKKAIGCRWILTVKLNGNGHIDRYKARVVAKGYIQRYGIDYQEAFELAAKLDTICILISIVANQEWPLQQFFILKIHSLMGFGRSVHGTVTWYEIISKNLV